MVLSKNCICGCVAHPHLLSPTHLIRANSPDEPTFDESGRFLLPAPILRVPGIQPGVEKKVEVTPGRIELLNVMEDDLPLITEVSPDGTLLFPAEVKPFSAETVVSAIKVDREGRIAKLARR